MMSKRRHNTQLFALSAPPPGEIDIGGVSYKLVRVFKHDFFAATALYEVVGGTWHGRPGHDSTSEPPMPLMTETAMPPTGETLPTGRQTPAPRVIPRIVVKFYRTQPFMGLSMAWLGRFSRDHEKAIYAVLEGVEGVPRWVGCVGQTGLAIEYVDADPLDHFDHVPAGYFDRMRRILDAVHARGVAYVDANKLSNMLVGADGEPHLIDFQIAVRRRDDWSWPMRAIAAVIVRYLQDRDIYHLYKHKRRLAPDELTDEEEKISRSRGRWHRFHRRITKPYRAVRRAFLRRQHQSGRLVSPSSDLEDHHQPEKRTWRG